MERAGSKCGITRTPKRGRPTPPFQRVQGSRPYRFLPPFFFPPLADDFFAIASIPPFTRGFCVGPCRAAAPLPPARRPALTAPRASFASTPARREVCSKKEGVPFLPDTPAPFERRVSASSRPLTNPSSRRPLRISSPLFLLGMWQLSLLTSPVGSQQVG